MRASRCSAVKVGRTTPVLGGGAAVGLAGAAGAGLAAAVKIGFAGAAAPCAGAAAGDAGAGRASPPAAAASPGVKIRRFTFSTTTALLRPCEKLCRTVPCSTGRFRCKVVFGGAAPKDLSLLFVSLMPIPNRLASQPIRPACQAFRPRRPARRRFLFWLPRPCRSRGSGANDPPLRERPNSLRLV